jgi:hypothetical protein
MYAIGSEVYEGLWTGSEFSDASKYDEDVLKFTSKEDAAYYIEMHEELHPLKPFPVYIGDNI